MTTKRAVISVFLFSLFLTGCGPKEHEYKYELTPATKDGGVYRLNKQSGEVLLIAAQASLIVQGTESVGATTNLVVDWGQMQLSQLGDVKVKLKTNWRGGKLYYLFTVSPYDHLSSIIKTAPNAQFFVSLYDGDGFRIFVIPINVADLTPTPSPGDKIDSVDMNANITCDLSAYQSLKNWSVSRSGL